MQSALSTSARLSAAAGAEVSSILEDRILGAATKVNLEETGKVSFDQILEIFIVIESAVWLSAVRPTVVRVPPAAIKQKTEPTLPEELWAL